MEALSPRAITTIWRALRSSMSRVALFLVVGMPVFFIMEISACALAMSYLAEWPYERGFDFMASAITGGAIVFPADPPQQVSSKLFATFAGAAGVGTFAFLVATLSHSVTGPILDALGLVKNDDNSVSGVMGRATMFGSAVICSNLLLALLFGSILAWLQGWDLFTGFKTMASVELGGGIAFDGMGSPTGAGSKLFFCVVGTWALGSAGLMISTVGGPCASLVEEAMHVTDLDTSTEEDARIAVKQNSKSVAVLVFLILPVVLLLVMLLVACIMAPLTAWEFENAFLAGLPAVSGGAAAFATNKNPTLSAFGAVVLVCAASLGFFVMSVMIGVGADMIGKIVERVPIFQEGSVARAGGMLLLITFVITPTLVLTCAVPVAGFFCLVQGWTFMEGFWWCVAVQLGGGMALSDVSIDTWPGTFLAIAAVGWSIGISILSVGLSGAPVVVPLMDALGMKLDKEDFEPLMEASRRASRSMSGHLRKMKTGVDMGLEALSPRNA